MQQRLPSLLSEPILFAHRGAKAHAPENTLTSFALARKLGATGIETDIWVTRDKEIVLDHDGLVRARLKRKPISQCSRSDLPSHIPSLGEYIALMPSGFPLSIDVNDVEAFSLFDQYSLDETNTWLCHPSIDELIIQRQRLPRMRLVNSVRLARIKEGPERRSARLAEHSIDALNMHITDWNGGLVALAHRFNLAAFGWDLQHTPIILDGLRMGLDAVFSDWVDRLVDAKNAL
jgi:glycerophosphoryl diester phosphodiesterase